MSDIFVIGLFLAIWIASQLIFEIVTRKKTKLMKEIIEDYNATVEEHRRLLKEGDKFLDEAKRINDILNESIYQFKLYCGEE